MYLPATFIFGDVHKVPEGSMNARKNEQGEVVIKYTYGVSLFYLPFFLAAKTYCSLAAHHDPVDYFNKDYCRAIGLCGYFFGFVGLFFLQKALRSSGFSAAVVALTLFGTLFGTNLFHYMTKEMGMSHVYSFCLFAFFIWQLPRFLQRPSWKNALLLGAALGWITLIRPTNAMIGLLLPLYGVYSWTELRVRCQFLVEKWPQLLAAAGAAMVLFLPQIWYWHTMTGEWLRYSYEGESFIYWNKPKIAAVLFDVQNGLFLYSPIVLLSIIGLGIGWRNRTAHAPVITLLFVLATYSFASWWAWWFGGAFGHRCYVEFYALLAFPMALFFAKTLALRNIWLKSLILFVSLFLMYYGAKLSFLYNQLPGPWDGEDWRWNWDKIKWVWGYLFKKP